MNRKNKLLFCVVFTLLFGMFLILFSPSGCAQEFSAQIRITQPEETYHFDYFVKNHLYRLEGEDSSGEPLVIIANRQEDSYVGLHPVMKFYMEFAREEIFLFNPIIGWEMLTRDYQEEKVGTEMMHGLECEKYTYTQEGIEGSIEAWYSPEIKQRIKVIVPLMNSEQSIFELLNIQIETQDEKYFMVPEDYEKMTSFEDVEKQMQSETNIDEHSTSKLATFEGEAPIGRIINEGSALRVQTEPSLEKNLVIENQSDIEASIVIVPSRAGETIHNQIIEKTISPKAKTKPSFSNSLKIDLIEIKVNEGTIKAIVLQESFFADEIERKEYYLFENAGQGLFFSEDKQVRLTIIGDNDTAGISQFEITFFKGEYQDPMEKLELSLQKGESRNWEFKPGEVKTVELITGDTNGGVKMILEQFR